MQLFPVRDAARRLGISYPTLKQWIYRRKIRSVKTAGGHHRIPSAELDRILFRAGSRRSRSKARRKDLPAPVQSEFTGLEQVISGRNQLVGRIVGVKTVGLLSKITLDIGGQHITSIITRDASRNLGLKVGETAAALIKATEVMIMRPMLRRS
jgi:molybdopterin-binding protein